MSPTDRDLLVYEALFHDAAEAAEADGLPMPSPSAAAEERLLRMIEAKRAALGERRLSRARAERLGQQPIKIRPGLRDKSSAWLLARVQELQAMIPREPIAVAHRDLEAASEDDLRSIVADLEALVLGSAADDEG